MLEARPAASAEEFRDLAWDWLLALEIQNALPLGILSNLLKKPPAQRQPHYFWTVTGGPGGIQGAAVWTPPYKFTVTEMPEEPCRVLAAEVAKVHPDIPGVGGPLATARTFAEHWKSGSRRSVEREMSMRIHGLERVEAVPESPGRSRLAAPSETESLVLWTQGLHADAKLNDPVDHRTLVEGYLREKRLFVWDDHGKRSMAGYGRETPRSFSVNMVYTPPEFRGRGYATSLVASLSRWLLDQGKRYCCLYTDLDNPTSNSIYARIGYRPVCDWEAYQFG